MTNALDIFHDSEMMQKIQSFAEIMATAKASIPIELQGNSGDCLAICIQSAVWQMNPFAVAQKTSVIKGRLCYEAQLVNAVINKHAPVSTRLTFKYSSGWERLANKTQIKTGKNAEYMAPAWNHSDEEGLWCEVSATMRNETEPRVLRVLLSQAWPRLSTQWATDPKQQLTYTAIKRWARLHCPDIILGVYTADEAHSDRPATHTPLCDRIAPTELESAINAFDQCATEETLLQCAENIKRCIPKNDLDAVRNAYAKRLEIIRSGKNE